jgi:parallel beta-helix repeat protein
MKKLAFSGALLLVAGIVFPGPDVMHANDSHAPITIVSDADFGACNCLTGGSGTATDPYVIGPWTINSLDANNTAVYIDGTSLTKSFTLFNLTIAGNGARSSIGIVLNHINRLGVPTISAAITGTQTSIESAGIGIVVENSSFITLDGGGSSPSGAGIAGPVGAINRNFTGAIDLENDSSITVKGWQFSANGQDNQPDWIAFDPSLANWGVGAVRLFGSTNTLVDHNAANNCTTVSFSVFDSNNNTISNNTADYPFTSNVLITDGSSFNLVSNNVFGTADFVGILIADPLPGTWTLNSYGPAHDNKIQGNVDHSDGGTGAERHGGIEPAFAGGVVILNGAYNNRIQNNQLYASGEPIWRGRRPSLTPLHRSVWQPFLRSFTAT